MILTAIVAAVVLGIAAQLVAERLKLPAILPLLTFGILAGPYFLGIFVPDAFGAALEPIIHLGVAIILFEGGLSLDPRQLMRVGGAVRNLLSLGMVITGLGAAFLARVVTDLPWSTAALFGAIVTVTGPTVIVPLLRHMIAPRGVKTILVSEGLLIDPIGAVLAYMVLQWIERTGVPLQPLASELLFLTAAGAILGFVAGSLGKLMARVRLNPELRNLSVLALVLLCFLVSEEVAHQSGILAVVVMGFTMSAAEIPDLEPLKTFKGQLTTLVISVLFILLSAQLDLDAMLGLGWRGLLVAAGLILLVRPLSVFLSVMPGQVDLKGRIVLAANAPRGIVAAAVASLAALELTRAGMAGGSVLEGLVYLVILVTGAWSTLMALILPGALGYRDDPSRRLTVLVGANPLSRELARLLGEEGRVAVVVDAVGRRLEPMKELGIRTVRGDAREAATYERAGVERDTLFLALTTNDELNLLTGELVHHEFGVEHPVVALQTPSEEFGSLRRAWMDLLGGTGVDVSRWIGRLENGRARMTTVALPSEPVIQELQDLLDDHPREVVLLCGWTGSKPVFRINKEDLGRHERVTLLVADGKASERLEKALAAAAAAAAAEEEAETDAEAGPG